MKISFSLIVLLTVASCFSLEACAQRPQRLPDKVKEGDWAPDFQLKSLDGKQTVKLSDFQGKKPVALIFGSYT